MKEYLQVAEDFGLSVTIPKTKLMVTGRQATEDNRVPLQAVIECVTEFPYIGSLAASSGRVDSEVDKCTAQLSIQSILRSLQGCLLRQHSVSEDQQKGLPGVHIIYTTV